MTDRLRFKHLTTGAKVFLGLVIALALISLTDFVAEGKVTDLLIAVGFALMAYGLAKNGFRRVRDKGTPLLDRNAQIASNIGTVLVLGSIVAGFVR